MFLVVDMHVSPWVVVVATPDETEARDTANTYTVNCNKPADAVLVLRVAKVLEPVVRPAD